MTPPSICVHSLAVNVSLRGCPVYSVTGGVKILPLLPHESFRSNSSTKFEERCNDSNGTVENDYETAISLSAN